MVKDSKVLNFAKFWLEPTVPLHKSLSKVHSNIFCNWGTYWVVDIVVVVVFVVVVVVVISIAEQKLSSIDSLFHALLLSKVISSSSNPNTVS